MMQPPDLERWIEQELARLPTPRAPQTLLPRVLAAAAAWRRPWYAREWRTWPRLLQAASLVVFAAATVAVGGVLLMLQSGLGSALVALRGGGIAAEALAWGHRLAVAAGAFGTVWDLLVAPLGFYLLMLTVLLYLAYLMCVVCGLALERVTSGRAWSL